MHGGEDYLAGLAQLHTRDSLDERRSLWRQGMASLAAAAADQQPTPLEGMATDQLLASVRVALGSGLVEDLSFLSRPVAAAALFELAGALPPSPEKREFGRRVLVDLNEGDAATFVTLATALALSSPRALGGAQIRARVALSLRLPLATGAHVDGLALALVSRPELERGWLTAHSMGALPARRLAARLLERAAREAARRAKEGDDSGVRVFERVPVRTAWSRLITDRESLVWRHVAAARGLLAVAAPMRAAEIERDLSPRLGPSEWRRAAASLAATVVHDPGTALPACLKLLQSEMQSRDSGIASAMIFGLSRVVEQEPEAADELLARLVPCGGIEAIEALADLREELAGHPIGAQAAFMAIDRLRADQSSADDGTVA
ncbi:MAG TPA: serine/threonine protein kinase, partial [Polyangia bacterium]